MPPNVQQFRRDLDAALQRLTNSQSDHEIRDVVLCAMHLSTLAGVMLNPLPSADSLWHLRQAMQNLATASGHAERLTFLDDAPGPGEIQ